MATKDEQFSALSKGLIAAQERLAVARLAGDDTVLAEAEVSGMYAALESAHSVRYEHDDEDDECDCVVCEGKRSADDEDEEDERG
jgi:hypothetical protein